MKKAPPVRLSLRKLLIAMLAVGPLAILPSPVLAALPTTLTTDRSVTALGNIIQTNGSGTLTSSGSTANISVSDRSILVWTPGSFNIAVGETYNFSVPNGSVLNKVGYNATTGAPGTVDNALINGTLTSNGKVFVLANGNIMVGPGAVINTASGLYLSTLNESNPDSTFLGTGNLAFTGTSQGSIIIGGGTAVTAGNISSSPLAAYSGNISVNNLTVSGDLILNQSASASGTGLNIAGTSGPTTVSGNLTAVTNNGTISQSRNVSVSGNTTFSTGTGNISLDAPAVLTSFTSGSGYTAAPTVTISGGGGTGAVATISSFNTTTGAIGGFTITNPGSGYTSAPSVTFSGGGAGVTSATIATGQPRTISTWSA